MAKMVSHARQLRLDLAAKLGRPVTIREVAAAIGEDRRVVMDIEGGAVERPHMEKLAKLASFYHGHGLDARRIIEFDPDAIREPDYAEQVEAEVALAA